MGLATQMSATCRCSSPFSALAHPHLWTRHQQSVSRGPKRHTRICSHWALVFAFAPSKDHNNRQSPFRRQVAAPWRTAVAMMIIGILGGLLFATGAPWSYPTLLRQVGNLTWSHEATFAPTTIVGPLAIFAGAITAAALGGRFVLPTVSRVQLGRSLAGGATMGFATILIPGGNDSLLLSALPSLAMHGALAYVTMLAVQISLSVVAKRWKDRNTRGATTRGAETLPDAHLLCIGQS
jgi:hypothetical protein